MFSTSRFTCTVEGRETGVCDVICVILCIQFPPERPERCEGKKDVYIFSSHNVTTGIQQLIASLFFSPGHKSFMNFPINAHRS